MKIERGPWYERAYNSARWFVWYWFDVPYQARRFKWMLQRAWRGWGKGDTYNLGPYACRVIAGMIASYREEWSRSTGGVPMGVMIEAGWREEMSEDEDREVSDRAITLWQRIMLEMQVGFESAAHVLDECECIPWGGDLPFSELDRIQREHQAKHTRLYWRGVVLFARHGLSLWD